MRDLATRARVARFGSVTIDGLPHLVPCCFALAGDALYTAVDDVKPKSTRALRRLDNIRVFPAVSVLVDHYGEDWSTLWWIRMDGEARVLEEASAEERHGLELLARKYEQYRARTIPGPVISVQITRWLAWP